MGNALIAILFLGAFHVSVLTQKAPESPFVPIYCEGDDLTYAKEKPKAIYKEVPGSKIEIPNMPLVRDQGQMNSCRAFSLAAILQKYTCDKWKVDIADCKNLEPDVAISYTGLMSYTNVSVDTPRTLVLDQLNKDSDSIYGILTSIQKNGAKFFTESCIVEQSHLKSFVGTNGLETRKKYFERLRELYEQRQHSSLNSCDNCSMGLRETLGIKVTESSLSLSFAKKTYEEFLYSIFFDGCKSEAFPADYTIYVYPLDSMNVSPSNIKERIVSGLSKTKPVLLSNLCTRKQNDGKCLATHALVISGYKKVSQGKETKEIFKVLNSWGAAWQQSVNEGWIDANSLVDNIALSIPDDPKENGRIPSGTVIWIE